MILSTGLAIQASLNFGLTVMFVVHIFGHISFAIINPAIVITAVVNKLIDIKVGKNKFDVKVLSRHF